MQRAVLIGVFAVDERLEGFQVVFGGFHVVERVNHVVHDRLRIHRVLIVLVLRTGGGAHEGHHQCTDIHLGRLDAQRVRGQRILLQDIDVAGHPLRHRENQRDADDADAARKGGKDGAPLLGEQVFQRQPERRRQ